MTIDDWYYAFTLVPSLGSVLAACSLIFIPWHLKHSGPRFKLIKYQAIADILFASVNILMFLRSVPCAIPLAFTKWAKCLSILAAVNLSFTRTNLFGLEPQTLAGGGFLFAYVFIGFLCGFFSVFPFTEDYLQTHNCMQILNTPKGIVRLLAGDILVPIAVLITILAVFLNLCKVRRRNKIEKWPLLLIGIWTMDLAATVIHYIFGREFPYLMIPKLFCTRCIGIANWLIYRKEVISLCNPKQGLEKALECIGRENDEAILITNQTERLACQIHGLALLHKGSHEKGYEELHKSLDRKYYDDLKLEEVSDEEANNAGRRQTTYKNEKVQKNNEEKARIDRERVEKEKKKENYRKKQLEEARVLMETNSSQDIEKAVSQKLKDVKDHDSLGHLAYQLHGVALCYSKNYDKALEEFEKSFEGLQAKQKPRKEKMQSSFATNRVDDLTQCLIEEQDPTILNNL